MRYKYNGYCHNMKPSGGMVVIYLFYAIIGCWTIILPLICIPLAIQELNRLNHFN